MAIFTILALLEMLFVNGSMFHRCAENKSSTSRILLVLSLFTVLYVGAAQLLFARTGLLGRGIFMVSGIVYLLPLTFLYRQPVKYSVIVMCSSWIYTMLLYALSIQIAFWIPWWESSLSILLIQTVLYALTMGLFFRFVNQKFIYIIKSADGELQNRLLLLGVSWFVLAVLLNCRMVFQAPLHVEKTVNLLILFLTAVNALMTYQIFYNFRRENRTVLEFERALRTDMLTGLKNRVAFFEDAQAKIDSGGSVAICFIDLDRFKAVNDSYGHLRGDQYLKWFAGRLSAVCASHGTAYRVSGDEFVLLCRGEDGGPAREAIRGLDLRECDGIPFFGFSMGWASYPQDGETLNQLVALADKRMYQEKREARA